MTALESCHNFCVRATNFGVPKKSFKKKKKCAEPSGGKIRRGQWHARVACRPRQLSSAHLGPPPLYLVSTPTFQPAWVLGDPLHYTTHGFSHGPISVHGFSWRGHRKTPTTRVTYTWLCVTGTVVINNLLLSRLLRLGVRKRQRPTFFVFVFFSNGAEAPLLSGIFSNVSRLKLGGPW